MLRHCCIWYGNIRTSFAGGRLIKANRVCSFTSLIIFLGLGFALLIILFGAVWTLGWWFQRKCSPKPWLGCPTLLADIHEWAGQYQHANHHAIPPAKTTATSVSTWESPFEAVAVSVIVIIVEARRDLYLERVRGSQTAVAAWPLTVITDVTLRLLSKPLFRHLQ